MTRLRRIGLFGGTFDPFHLGHLAVARAARHQLALDEVRLVPTHVPPHRPEQPHASAHHRFAMAALGIADEPALLVSDIELASPGPTYTADTLRRLHRQGLSPSQIFFISGADAFAEIATWHDYPGLLDLAHFAVIARPKRAAATLRADLPALASRMREVTGPGSLPPEVSAEHFRTLILLIDEPTPDVSGTMIREAQRAGRAIGDLVPGLVARHIARHRLYDVSSQASGVPEAASELHEQEHA